MIETATHSATSPIQRQQASIVLLVCAIGLLATASTGSAAPPAASRETKLIVPSGMAASPFDTPRTLTIPPGFTISVHARVPGARFMAVAPTGDLLTSKPGAGSITL